MYAGACFVAGASVPARVSLPPPPPGKKRVSRFARITTHITGGAQHSGQPPPHEKEVCGKMRAYRNTHNVPVNNIAVDEKPVDGGSTRDR